MATKDQQTGNIALPREWHRRLKVVAAHRGQSIVETYRQLVGHIIDAEYAKVAVDREYREAVGEADAEFQAQEG